MYSSVLQIINKKATQRDMTIYISIYVCIYVYSYVYIYIHICNNIHICIYIYIHIQMYIELSIYNHMCTYNYLYIITYVHTFMYVYILQHNGRPWNPCMTCSTAPSLCAVLVLSCVQRSLFVDLKQLRGDAQNLSMAHWGWWVERFIPQPPTVIGNVER